MQTKFKGLYEPADIGTMSPITKALNAFMKTSGLKLTEAGRLDITAINGLFINRLVYENSAGERVFITSQEKGNVS